MDSRTVSESEKSKASGSFADSEKTVMMLSAVSMACVVSKMNLRSEHDLQLRIIRFHKPGSALCVHLGSLPVQQQVVDLQGFGTVLIFDWSSC